MPPRIVLVGGGSPAWGPLLLRDIFTAPALAGSTVGLYDRGSEAVERVFGLGQRLIADNSLPMQIERCSDLDRALAGATFVLVAIGAGGLAAMRRDLEICQAHGVVHSVGDTVGPGGLARALRTIPVIADLARRMERACPDAWLLNLSNPMSALCRAVARTTAIRIVGLCHEVPRGTVVLRRLLGLEPQDRLAAQIIGINHLPWLTGLKVNGRDALPLLAEVMRPIAAGRTAPGIEADDGSSMADGWRVKAALHERLGVLPLAGDRHVAEFFPDFLSEAAERGLRYGVRLTTLDERRAWRARDEARLEHLLESPAARRAFCASPSGEAVAPIMEAVVTGQTYTGVVNLSNRGQAANLSAGAIVETLGLITADGAMGQPAGALPPEVQAITARHIANQEAVVEAALTGERGPALEALANDPLVGPGVNVELLLKQLAPDWGAAEDRETARP